MPNKPIVLVDMDGVLADFELWFLQWFMKRHPELEFIPVQDRRNFYGQDDYPPGYTPLIHKIFESEGFFLGMPPIEGALEAMQTLAAKNDVFICTAPFLSSRHCVGEKFEWVRKHLGEEWVRRVIISKDKTVAHGDYLIDDKPVITGVRRPNWEHIVFDAPYNREIKNRRRIVNWRTIYDVLLELK